MKYRQIEPQLSSVAILAAMLMLWVLFSASPGLSKEITGSDPTDKAQIQESYGKLPLYFIQNNGQVDGNVQFYDRGSGHSTFFAKDGVYLTLTQKIGKNDTADASPQPSSSHLVKLSFLNANPNPKIIA